MALPAVEKAVHKAFEAPTTFYITPALYIFLFVISAVIAVTWVLRVLNKESKLLGSTLADLAF